MRRRCIGPWTNLGVNAHIRNHHGASGGYDFDTEATVSQEAPANEATLDRELLRQAIRLVGSHPVEAVALIPKKIVHLYFFEGEAVILLFQGERNRPAWGGYGLYAICQMCYLPALMLFCLKGHDHPCKTSARDPVERVIFDAYFTVVALVFFGQDRFRLPILPWMVIESSAFLAGRVREGLRFSVAPPGLPF